MEIGRPLSIRTTCEVDPVDQGVGACMSITGRSKERRGFDLSKVERELTYDPRELW